jgi:hypothetical protein
MALHDSQRTKTLNSSLIEGYNIVWLFSFVNNIVQIGKLVPGKVIFGKAQDRTGKVLALRWWVGR